MISKCSLVCVCFLARISWDCEPGAEEDFRKQVKIQRETLLCCELCSTIEKADLETVPGHVPLFIGSCGWVENPWNYKLFCWAPSGVCMWKKGIAHLPSLDLKILLVWILFPLVVQRGEGRNLPHNKTGQWQPSVSCLRQKCNSNIFTVPKRPFTLLLLILRLRHLLLSLFLRQWNWMLINVHVVLLSPSHHAQTFLWMTVTVSSGYMLETPKFSAPIFSFYLFKHT